ncbi:MAG TPA: DUF533 domain-containing protein [Kofleriaceae bacterium]|nr:DUF533 domain-containing protein [Kofleriaceae bacterium]
MADSPFLNVIRIWAATAWADGKLAEQEAHALRRLIDGAELDDAEREIARGFLDAKVELDEKGLATLSSEAKRGVYRAACRMAALDREVHVEERAMLDRLRDGLGLPGDEAVEIEKSVPGLS